MANNVLSAGYTGLRQGKVVSINAGQPAPLETGRRTVLSAIRKAPLTGRVRVGKLGIEVDVQADRSVHGGVDKALCFYPAEHLAQWTLELDLPSPLAPGEFGENVTVAGLFEDTVYIGDVLRLGDAIVEVSQPRSPCFRLAALHQRPNLVRQVVENLRTGWFARVLEPGFIEEPPVLVKLSQGEGAVTVAMAAQAGFWNTATADLVRQVMAAPALSEGWREALADRLDGSED